MESLQDAKISQSGCFLKLVLYKEQYFYTTIPNAIII